jgi:hypoxanthine phosphoribosyltransferase
MRKTCSRRAARRVLTCVLLEKPGKRAVSLDADFVGFTVLICSSSATAWTSRTRSGNSPFAGVVEK